jgi:hypothetical protein
LLILAQIYRNVLGQGVEEIEQLSSVFELTTEEGLEDIKVESCLQPVQSLLLFSSQIEIDILCPKLIFIVKLPISPDTKFQFLLFRG